MGSHEVAPFFPGKGEVVSERKKIDDKDLTEITGAGDVCYPKAHINDSTPGQDAGTGASLGEEPADSGGSGPGSPEPSGVGGSGNQTPNMD
jgi:hypothetical protein